MELKDRTQHKNCVNENATNEESCGLIKSPTFSKLQFPRDNLSTVMLLGKWFFCFLFSHCGYNVKKLGNNSTEFIFPLIVFLININFYFKN